MSQISKMDSSTDPDPQSWWHLGLAAIAFYTVLPIPWQGSLEFRYVARLAPLVGLIIGTGVGGMIDGLAALGLPSMPCAALGVCSWIAVTGGLHLDGVMDTADGLAVMDPQRRLVVMADSVTGAFGVMAAIALVLLKTTVLTAVMDGRWLWLGLIAGWGRWAQQVAIARYPYLKPTGKGAMHQSAFPSLWHLIPMLLLLLAWSVVVVGLQDYPGSLGVALNLSWVAIAFTVPHWFYLQLGGQTGDTYGAVVEWTETLSLIVLACLLA